MLAQDAVNPGDTAWVLVCAAAVLFMTPGLALFYAGMVSRRNTLVMLQQNFIPLGVISLTWVLVGYSLAFGDDTGNGLIGDLELFGLQDLGQAPAARPAQGGHRRRHPDAGVRRLPDDVRGHHPGAGHRAPSPAGSSRWAGRCSSRCGRSSSTPRSRTGSGRRQAG